MAFTLTGNEIIFINPLQANGQPGATLQQTSVQNVASVPPIFGSGTGTFQNQGNIYRLFTAGTSPASTAADIVVATYTLPANSFDISGRTITFYAAGNFGANANNKTCKIIVGATTATVGSAIVGGTTLATTGVSASTSVGWSLTGNLSKYGAAGSNTQNYQEMSNIVGTVHGGMGMAATTTFAENASIICAVTINCATTNTDASLWQFEVNVAN